MNDCAFCGPTTRAVNEEHIWADWITRLLLRDRHRTHRVRMEANSSRRTEVVVTRRRRMDVTAKVVCETCNNKWMSDLENRVKPIAEPLMLGQSSVALTFEDQATLTAWIMKTAIVVEHDAHVRYRRPRFFFSPAQRERFRDTLDPPSTVVIWIARRIGNPKHWGHLRTLYVTPRTRHAKHLFGYVFTFSARELVCQVVAVKRRRPGIGPTPDPAALSFVAPHLPWSDYTLQLWPSLHVEPLVWPPERSLTDRTLAWFGGRFGSASAPLPIRPSTEDAT
jgi:hypothetical protein